jgi:hypothetical protein
MSDALSLPAAAADAGADRAARRSGVVECCLWLLLFVVLAVDLPAFLCMGLNTDALQWDVCAHSVLQGGVAYRDAAENNLPGMLWLHLLIRGLFGWRPEVLRLADLLIVLAVIWRLSSWLPSTATRSQRLGLALVLLVFYLSTTEWSHCQRDVWMLLPALLALGLRRRQMQRLSREDCRGRWVAGSAFAEGLLWSAAFWIKPFVGVPALLCWLISARLACRAPAAKRWNVALDGAALLAGGLAGGLAGCAWLVGSGAWPSFFEIVFVWNRQYIVHDLTGEMEWLGGIGFFQRLFPWMLVHLIAVPDALRQIWRAVAGRSRPAEPETAADALLAGVYLGWLAQACFLQHLFDYVLAPPVLLGLTLVARRFASTQGKLFRGLVLTFLVTCMLWLFPRLYLDRLGLWGRCVREGSTPELRDRLNLTTQIDWSELEQVSGYLRGQDVRDGEVSCTHMGILPLYGELGVRPSTRFNCLRKPVTVFKGQRDYIYGLLADSPQRFMVCDIDSEGMAKSPLPAALRGEAPPASYPWLDRIVFRSGRYVVFRLSGPETPRWLEATFEL